MRKQLPIGISDYKALREGDYYYVDKSTINPRCSRPMAK